MTHIFGDLVQIPYKLFLLMFLVMCLKSSRRMPTISP